MEYNRFSPIVGKVVQNRAVTGKISLQSRKEAIFAFRPAITEKNLTVLDYSSRYELYPWTKGIADWYYRYDLTNQNWDFDTNTINAQVAQVKANMSANNGYPKELLDRANTLSKGLS